MKNLQRSNHDMKWLKGFIEVYENIYGTHIADLSIIIQENKNEDIC